MRALEIVLLVLLAVAAWRFRRGPRSSRAVPELLAALVVVVLAAHALAEGLRWQLVPAYLLVVATVAGALARDRTTSWSHRERSRWRTPLALAGLATVVVTALLAALLPVPRLPEPGGEHAVGTFVTSLVDRDRADPYAPADGTARELPLQVYYPAVDGTGGEPAPWVADAGALSDVASSWLGVPAFALRHAALVEGQARDDARAARGTDLFPVVVFSHGWGGFRNILSSQLTSLASHGFVVVTLDHTYGSLAAMFPDGSAVRLEPSALPDEGEVGPDAYARAARTLVSTYRDDLRAVLSWLADLDARPDGELAGRLDLTRIALVGHSTGGGAAVEVCATDPRCAALVAYDAWVNPVSEAVLEDGLPVPTLFVGSEQWLDEQRLNESRLGALSEASRGEVVRLRLDGLAHRDFSVLGLLSPASSQLGISGPLEPRTALRLLDDATVGFLRHALLGERLDPEVFERERDASPMWRED